LSIQAVGGPTNLIRSALRVHCRHPLTFYHFTQMASSAARQARAGWCTAFAAGKGGYSTAIALSPTRTICSTAGPGITVERFRIMMLDDDKNSGALQCYALVIAQ
jgi:hypothetical protein